MEGQQAKAVEVPPEVPGWAQAVKVVANIDARNAGADILSDIHKSMVKSHSEAMGAYRKSSGERHSLLRRMMPDWRLVTETLGHVAKSVESVIARALTIDRHMEEYEAIVRGEDRAVSVLSSSSIVYFFVSLVVLAVATAGAAVNFTLIARPMAEMVGGTSFIGVLRTADLAALVIIMVEISMGLFLMESLRITRLFPVIGALSDQMRVRMIMVTFTILLRVLGNGFRHLGGLAQRLYDLPLFVPLWIEMRMAATEPAAGPPGSRGRSGEGRSFRGAQP